MHTRIHSNIFLRGQDSATLRAMVVHASNPSSKESGAGGSSTPFPFLYNFFKKLKPSPGVVVNALHPSTQAAIRRLWIWGQPGLQTEFQNPQGYKEKSCFKGVGDSVISAFPWKAECWLDIGRTRHRDMTWAEGEQQHAHSDMLFPTIQDPESAQWCHTQQDHKPR